MEVTNTEIFTITLSYFKEQFGGGVCAGDVRRRTVRWRIGIGDRRRLAEILHRVVTPSHAEDRKIITTC
jgi:hypothetical protein